jgi:calcium-dependent protein kinase
VTAGIRDIKSKYDIDPREIGHGHYGVVRKAKNRETGEAFAIKSIRKAKVSRLDSLRREIDILQAVDHPQIIKLVDVYEDDKFLHLVTELCTGGEMFDRIIAKTKSAEGHYSEKDAAVIMRKILDAIDYCHTVHNICHRDLKPENFLFKTEDPSAELKIIDFGLSRFEDDQKYMTTRVGTPYCKYSHVGGGLD